MQPKKAQPLFSNSAKGPHGVPVENKAPAKGLCPIRIAMLPMILPGLSPTKLKERLAVVS